MMGSNKSGQYHIDTDGYTDFLFSEAHSPLKLSVSVGPGTFFTCDLPSIEDLGPRQPLPLNWSQSRGVPDIAGARPIPFNEWPTSMPPGVPAIFCRQSNETSIYFFYSLPITQDVILTSKISGFSGSLFKDLEPLGVSNRTPLKLMEINP